MNPSPPPPTDPHDAIFLTLPYLPLPSLLSTTQVCKSLRRALDTDVLPWLHLVVVEKPLNLRVSDDVLADVASKANGKLRSLVLRGCVKVTDGGVARVVERNPEISVLHVPGCSGLTPEGVIRAVKILNRQTKTLKSLRINGIYNLKKEHLETLSSLLKTDQQQHKKRLNLYPKYKHSSWREEKEFDQPSIDVEICPICQEVRLVFDCPKESCRVLNKPRECRGCILCIPRCEECGKCVESDDECEVACADILCPDCWLQLPKCVFCNKPYCNQHVYKQCSIPCSSRFVCDTCHAKFVLELVSVS